MCYIPFTMSAKLQVEVPQGYKWNDEKNDCVMRYEAGTWPEHETTYEECMESHTQLYPNSANGSDLLIPTIAVLIVLIVGITIFFVLRGKLKH